MKNLTGIVVIALIVALPATGGLADLRQGNVRHKETCAIPPGDCVYTQSGWHKTYGTWYVSRDGQWSDGTSSVYIAYPFGTSCDSLVSDVYVGGGFGYFGHDVPETMTIDFLRPYADPLLREVSGCCHPSGESDLVARYTINVADVWPAQYSDVYGCLFADYEKFRCPLNPPLQLDADCNYYIAYYANAGDTARLWATIDMLCGRDSFTASYDAGKSFDPRWLWFGGRVASGLDFELRGDLLDCFCLCDACADAGWDVLYDQASKHSFSNGKAYGGRSYGGGDATGILGQSFQYQWDGYLKCVGVGGLFGGFNGEYQIPDHLIVELWCWSAQEGWELTTLLRRWMIPVAELKETEDPEGYPLQNFFTEDYPGPYTWCDTTAPGGGIWATDDRPFLLVAYSDGAYDPDTNMGAPFLWLTDMSKGYCSFSGSADCEYAWVHNYFWGDPEAGSPESNFEFLLCGGCTEVCGPVQGDEVVDSGYLAGPLFGQPQGGYPAWVWFSIPLDPANCCDAADCSDPNTLLGFNASGKLFYWDKYLKATVVYRPPFSKWPLKVGESYLFYMDVAVPNPCYEGINPYVSSERAGGEPRFFGYDYGTQLGKQGWTWVGLPGDKPIRGGGLDSDFATKVRVMYPALPTWQGGTGVARTAAEDVGQTPNNWVDWGWSYYDTRLQSPKAFKFNATFGNKHCFPWIGYRVWVKVGTAAGPYNPLTGENEDQAVLIWPAPECYQGTFPPE